MKTPSTRKRYRCTGCGRGVMWDRRPKRITCLKCDKCKQARIQRHKRAREKANVKSLVNASNHGKSWSLRDNRYLMQAAGKLSCQEMAADLGRTIDAVRIQLKRAREAVRAAR